MGTPETFSVTRRPVAPLAGLVDHYAGYRMAGFPPGVHRGAPSRHMTFIVAIGPEIDVVRQTDARQAPRRYRAVLSGLQASAALIAHDGYQEGVSIALSPLGCRALFALPARELWDTTLELDEVVGATGRELAERLQGSDSWDDRFAACDDVLLRLLHRSLDRSRARPEPELALAAAWTGLVRSGGSAPIGELARTVGWTRQHLRSRFVDELGIGPKLAGRVIRVERARRLLLARERTAKDGMGESAFAMSIADVAAHCGYYDQAHLTRDFVELIGCSPARLVVEELPSVQDPDEREGAPWAP